MDYNISKSKKGLLTKTWERCKSFGGSRDGGESEGVSSSRIKRCFLKNIKSFSRLDSNIRTTLNVAPIGYFSVYVGPQKQRFVIKTKHVNHPLFITLLEEAEFEDGYKSDGPLELPCDVDWFLKVLSEMEECNDMLNYHGCTFATKGFYHPLTSGRIIAINNS